MIIICVIIVVLAFVQSIFGIGLLAFGTPTLILIGYSFEDALCILLPASLSISWFQLISGRTAGFVSLRPIIFWALPLMSVAMYIALKNKLVIHLELAIAVLLLVSAAARMSKTIRIRLQQLMRQHEPVTLMLIGLVHGFTNMGGGLLAIYSSVRYSEKIHIRQMIVAGYVTFATMQIAMLIWQRGFASVAENIAFAGLAAVVYLACGHLFFNKITASTYDIVLSCFMMVYAGVLICKYFNFF